MAEEFGFSKKNFWNQTLDRSNDAAKGVSQSVGSALNQDAIQISLPSSGSTLCLG
jgi:hypothetical protein